MKESIPHKPFSCQQCDNKFANSVSLREHESIHSAEQLSCPQCNQEFSSSEALKKNERLQKKTFNCEYCDKKKVDELAKGIKEVNQEEHLKYLKKKHENIKFSLRTVDTVEPCILEQIEHLWGPVVTKPMILLTKSSNMTLGRYIGLQHIQKSAS